MASRYGIENDDLRVAALQLQVGEGISQRMSGLEATEFIEDGEEWAEDQIGDYITTPLKAIPARGQTTVPDPVTKKNYPREFILAATYWAVGRLLHSEFFENEPNRSDAAAWAEEMAVRHVLDLRSRSTTRVGAGRRRHPNPFMPPNIAPREEIQGPQGGSI